VQETEVEGQPGFLIYVPLYRGSPEDTDERQERLEGFFYAPFRSLDFFSSIFPADRHLPVAFSVFSGSEATAGRLLFSYRPLEEDGSEAPIFREQFRMEVAGQEWTIEAWRSQPSIRGLPGKIHYLIFLAGLIISALLAWIALRGIRHAELEAAQLKELQQLGDRDRSRVRELEDLARENSALYQEARRALRTRDDFLTLASHELKTPLTSLHLQNQLLRSRLEKGQELQRPDLTKFSLSLERQTRRLANLIQNLLEISRISSGKLQLNTKALELEPFLADILERLHFQIEDLHRVRVTVRKTPTIVGDPERLEQVIVNLLSNALKYSSAPVDLELDEEGSEAILRVRDQGPGIPPEMHRRIFEQFERAVSDRGISGLGIGLSISREIVAAHQGRIALASAVGQGSTFTVRLPLPRA
jgi:signal transduction histidine kinase